MKQIKKYIAICMLSLIGVAAYSQTGLDIMKINDDQQSSKSEQVKLTMTLINNSGKKRVRQVQRFSITDDNDNRSSLIRFLYPADVKGTGYLEIEHTAKNDDAWLYLPALNKSRRISTADETDNFMSSEFTYEDLGSEDLDHYTYSLDGKINVNGVDCYKIIAVPATDQKKKESCYSKRIIYVAKDNYVTQKIDFYNKKGALYKQFVAEDIKQIAGSQKVRAHKMTMTNLQTRYVTVLEFEEYNINASLGSDIFSLRNLESGAH